MCCFSTPKSFDLLARQKCNRTLFISGKQNQWYQKFTKSEIKAFRGKPKKAALQQFLTTPRFLIDSSNSQLSGTEVFLILLAIFSSFLVIGKTKNRFAADSKKVDPYDASRKSATGQEMDNIPKNSKLVKIMFKRFRKTFLALYRIAVFLLDF